MSLVIVVVMTVTGSVNAALSSQMHGATMVQSSFAGESSHKMQDRGPMMHMAAPLVAPAMLRAAADAAPEDAAVGGSNSGSSASPPQTPQQPMIMSTGQLQGHVMNLMAAWREVMTTLSAAPLSVVVMSSNSVRDQWTVESWLASTEKHVVEGATSISAELRVPGDQYDAAITAVTTVIKTHGGVVLSINSDARDVTAEYVDTLAWEGVERATVQRLTVRQWTFSDWVGGWCMTSTPLPPPPSPTPCQELMNRANTVADVLAVQKEMSEAQRRLDSAVGRRKYLETRTATSTLHVSLSVPPPPAPPPPPPRSAPQWSPLATASNAFRFLVHMLQSLVDSVITIAIVVVIPVTAAVLFAKMVIRIGACAPCARVARQLGVNLGSGSGGASNGGGSGTGAAAGADL